MAAPKKRVVTTEEIVDADPTEPKGESELEDDVIRALTEIEGANEIRWQIHRVSQPDPGYCGECSTAELSLQHIAETYGSGRYQIKGIRADGKYFKSRQVAITKNPKKTDATPDLIAALKGGGTDQNVLLAIMQMQSQAQQAASTAQAQIMSALIAKPDNKMPWGEIAAVGPPLLLAIKELFARKDESGEAMDKFLKTLTIVEKLRGDDKKEGSTWTDILRDALPALSGMVSRPGAAHGTSGAPLAARAGVVPQSPAGVLAQPGSVDAATIDTPEAVAPTQEVMAMDFFKTKIEELLRNAAQNKDPELRADVFLDDLPDFVPESVLLELLTQPDWFDRLALFDERVRNYQGWFTDLREYLLHALQNADQDPSESEKENAV